MENTLINLTAYVDGIEVTYALNPAYKSFSNEAYNFANSICELCKIIIRNRINKTGENYDKTVGIMLFYERGGLDCPNMVLKRNKPIMTDEEFEFDLFALRLEIRKVIVDAVACDSRFINQ